MPAAAQKKQCLLLGEACLAVSSRRWVQHCGMTLPMNVFLFFLFSPVPEMLSLHREEEQREQGALYWETSSCRYCGASVRSKLSQLTHVFMFVYRTTRWAASSITSNWRSSCLLCWGQICDKESTAEYDGKVFLHILRFVECWEGTQRAELCVCTRASIESSVATNICCSARLTEAKPLPCLLKSHIIIIFVL